MNLSRLLLPITFVTQIYSECINQDKRNIFLWSIFHPELQSRGFLFGTIHVPYTEVWDKVSDRVREAFSLAETILLEVDLQNEQTIRKLMRCKNLPKKLFADTYLPANLYSRIEEFMHRFRHNLFTWAERQSLQETDSFLRAKQVFDDLAEDWNRKRPEWLLFSLYQLCDDLLDRPTSPMLDVFLAQKALSEDKSIKGIETAQEQCNPISSLSRKDIVFAINYTLSYLEHLHADSWPFSKKKGRSISKLVEDYRCGSPDVDLLGSNGITGQGFRMTAAARNKAKAIDLTLREDIIVRRNERMAHRLNKMFSENPEKTTFTAIGTGHFFGENSILSHLERLGYIISPLKDDDILALPSVEYRNFHFNSLWTKERRPVIPEVVIELIETSVSVTFDSHLILCQLIFLCLCVWL